MISEVKKRLSLVVAFFWVCALGALWLSQQQGWSEGANNLSALMRNREIMVFLARSLSRYFLVLKKICHRKRRFYHHPVCRRDSEPYSRGGKGAVGLYWHDLNEAGERTAASMRCQEASCGDSWSIWKTTGAFSCFQTWGLVGRLTYGRGVQVSRSQTDCHIILTA